MHRVGNQKPDSTGTRAHLFTSRKAVKEGSFWELDSIFEAQEHPIKPLQPHGPLGVHTLCLSEISIARPISGFGGTFPLGSVSECETVFVHPCVLLSPCTVVGLLSPSPPASLPGGLHRPRCEVKGRGGPRLPKGARLRSSGQRVARHSRREVPARPHRVKSLTQLGDTEGLLRFRCPSRKQRCSQR